MIQLDSESRITHQQICTLILLVSEMSKGLVSFEYDDDVDNASTCSDQVDDAGSDLNDSLSPAESDFESDIKPAEHAADATSVTLLAEALAADASRTELPTVLLQTRAALVAPAIAKLDGTSICQACNLVVARYRCPACSTLSCSLACINQHKSEDSCSGQRNRTTFVPLSGFDDQLLMEGSSLKFRLLSSHLHLMYFFEGQITII
jgi:hypothetical protein